MLQRFQELAEKILLCYIVSIHILANPTDFHCPLQVSSHGHKSLNLFLQCEGGQRHGEEKEYLEKCIPDSLGEEFPISYVKF